MYPYKIHKGRIKHIYLNNDNGTWIQQLTIEESNWIFFTKTWHFNYFPKDKYNFFNLGDSCWFWTENNIVKFIKQIKG